MMRRLASLALLVAAALGSATVARAADPGFDDVVRHIETTFNARRSEPGGMWFARLMVRFAHPKGIKSVKLAMFEDLRGPSTDPDLARILRVSLDASWKPIVRATSRVDLDQTFVYARPAGDDIELMIVSVDETEATVAKLTVDPASVGDWLHELDS